MKNFKSDFKVIYRINFLMEDSTFNTKNEGIVIESENEKQVQDLLQIYFKTNPESFMKYPEDMINKVVRQELIIVKEKKVWSHQNIFQRLIYLLVVFPILRFFQIIIFIKYLSASLYYIISHT